jgi:hypothetical protein
MPEKLLHLTDISTVIEHVRGKRVSQHVRSDPAQSGFKSCDPEYFRNAGTLKGLRLFSYVTYIGIRNAPPKNSPRLGF